MLLDIQDLLLHHLHLLDEEVVRACAVILPLFLSCGVRHAIRVRLLPGGVLDVLGEFVDAQAWALAHAVWLLGAGAGTHQVLAALHGAFVLLLRAQI